MGVLGWVWCGNQPNRSTGNKATLHRVALAVSKVDWPRLDHHAGH